MSVAPIFHNAGQAIGNYLSDELKKKKNVENEQWQRERAKLMAESVRNKNTQTTKTSPGINPAYQYKNKDEDLGTMSKTIYDEQTPGTNNNGGVGSYYGSYASFKPSAEYTQAMNYLNSLRERINTGRTSYSDKIDSIMSQIENRQPFNYDFNTDPLFQNALQGAMSAGQTAMQDTMGQAAALTGGYGSSYATSAANQAYNQFVKGAYENLPDYYNLARNAYNEEGQELLNRLGMYQTADESEYNRLNNAYGINADAAARLYEQEYNNFWQTQNFNESSRQWAANMNYKQEQARLAEEKAQKEADAKAEEEALKNQYAKLDDKLYQTGLAYYDKYGPKAFEKFANEQNLSDEDLLKFYDFVTAKGAAPEYYLKDNGSVLKGYKDNTYTNQWDDETYTYEQLIDMIGKEAAKKTKKKS